MKRGSLSRWKVPLGIILAAMTATATPAFGQTVVGDGATGLSLDEALETARLNNPDLRIQSGQLEVADRQLRAARDAFFPTVNASNSYGFQASGERRAGSVVLGEQPEYYSSSYSLNMSYSLNGATLLRPGQARIEAEATRARVAGAAMGLGTQVTDAYLTVLQADAQLDQAERALERTQLTVRQARAQVEVGAATPLDVRRAEVQEGQAEVQLVQSRNQAGASRLNLARVMGVELPDGVRLTTTFDEALPELDVEALIARASETNPVVRATRLTVDASRAAVRSSRTAYFPNLSLSAGLSGSIFVAGDLEPLISQEMSSQAGRYEGCRQDNRLRELLGDPPRDCDAMNPELPGMEAQIRDRVAEQHAGYPFSYRRQPLSLSMSLSLPIFTAGQRSRTIEQAQLDLTNSREQLRSEELRLRTEVTFAVQAVTTSRRIVDLQERIRRTAAEELRLAQERFRLGIASSIEVADAQNNLSQAERDEINARYEYQKAINTLESLVGGTVRP